MPLGALVACMIVASPQKTTEVWKLRTNLNGQYVEIYDVVRGNEKLGTGLRQIVERHNYYQPDREKKYADLLKPEWDGIYIAQERFIFAISKKRPREKLWLIPSSAVKDRVKVEKPVLTPYTDIYGGVTSFIMGGVGVAESLARANAASDVFAIREDLETGKRPNIEALAKLNLGYQSGRVLSLDVMDRDFNIKFTVHNARVLPHRYGSVWRVQYDTDDLAPINVFLDDEGQPVSPDIPLVREFAHGVLAIPTTLEFERYIPILKDGRTKLEPTPTAGYYPDVAIRSKKGWYGYNFANWTKEYITPDGPRFGWASLDLSKESGPIWKSINWWEHSFNPQAPGEAIVAQLVDGGWMIYDLKPNANGEMPHRPFFEKPFATRQEAINAYVPIYNREIAEPIIARKREEAKQYAIQFEEMTKYLEIDPTMSAGSMPASELRSLLYSTVTMLNARLYNDFDAAYKKLPGDYFLKYLAMAYQLRRVNMTPQDALAYANQAVNPGIKQTFLGISENLKREAAVVAARAAEAKKAREMGWSDPGKFSPRNPAPTPGWSNPWKDPYAAPSFSESSRRHEQYMSEMWKYLGGQQSWRPYR